MAGSFLISPGVLVKEQDFSLIVPTVPVNIGAVVGDFNWGPVEEITLISDEPTLAQVFDPPVNRNAKDWFTARNFLTYSKNLYAVRMIDDVLTNYVSSNGSSAVGNAVDLTYTPTHTYWNAPASGTPSKIIVKNHQDFLNQYDTLKQYTNGTNKINFIARYPGSKGNNIQVAFTGTAGFGAWTYADRFSFTPTLNELAMVVLLNGQVVETFFVSLIPGTVDGNGQPMYIGNVLNDESQYVYVLPANFVTYTGGHNGDTYVAGDAPTVYPTTVVSLIHGGDTTANSSTAMEAGYFAGWALFAAASDISINYCMQGGADPVVGNYIIENVAMVRKDCVAFVSPRQQDVVNNATPSTTMVNFRQGGLTDLSYNIDSSYAFLDGNYKYQFDNYNLVYRWVPFNGDMAGLLAQTAYTNDPWWSPAGLNRGQIKDVVKLAFNPTQAMRDQMYSANINPIVSFPGQGVVLYGDKTMQARPSAFDRINVRMLFIVIEVAIAKAAQYLLFEFNDVFTQNRFVQMVEPYLRDVQARRGIEKVKGQDGFYIIADSRVNTPQVIDSNQFVATILIKPARSINFITLTFAATSTGVEFAELAAEITGSSPTTGTINLSA
jgi:hypothetical protein